MDGKNLSKLIIILFESKLKNYTEITVSTWVDLLNKFPENEVIAAIENLIYKKDDFISIGQIFEIINPPPNLEEKVQKEWGNILRKCQGKSAEIDSMAAECFKMISSYDGYGYETDEFKKERIKREWKELYKKTLEGISNNKMKEIRDDK